MPKTNKTYHAKLELAVAQCWIDDGFELNQTWLDAIAHKIGEMLPYSTPEEFKVSVSSGKLTGKSL